MEISLKIVRVFNFYIIFFNNFKILFIFLKIYLWKNNRNDNKTCFLGSPVHNEMNLKFK